MNKWTKGAAAALLALALSACGTSSEPEKSVEAQGDTGKKTEVSKKEPVTAENIFKKSMEASESMNSMHADFAITQNLKITGEEEMSMKNDLSIMLDIVNEPEGLHQKVTSEGDAEGSMDIEMYGAKGELYMQMPDMNGSWMAVPPEMQGELIEGMNSSNAMMDLEVFEDFRKKFTVEEEKNEYILKLDASGEEFQELLHELMNQGAMAGQEFGDEDAIENIDVRKIELSLHIDKETYYTNSLDMILDAVMDMEGFQAEINQTIHVEMSKMNELEEIIIPDEVRNNAFDMEGNPVVESE
ncbi:DUF6612 family protein [Sporosarcina aquimarina]|uniref:Lipoprotein n=1 Tax=Sporosarcina aquimarina TaxID=114975 RepID=A0ABU4G122_9BACL|nr:DUF6612 family protein [Sporosarcina aquimarina]MDW0110102.1 hypothetical protein [Sporosarcina aquimarina]